MGPIVLMGALLNVPYLKAVVYLYPWHHLAQTHCEMLEALSLHQVNHVEVFLVWDFLVYRCQKSRQERERAVPEGLLLCSD